MGEQLRLGALHWLGHCRARTGGPVSKPQYREFTHGVFLSTLDTNVDCAQTRFCFCDLNSVETPMLSGCATQISGRAF